MGIQSIECYLPFCGDAHGRQTECSLITRVIAAGLGGIALSVGILALSGVPELHALGTVGGSILTTVGGFTLLVSFCVRCVKELAVNGREQQSEQDIFVFAESGGTRNHSTVSNARNPENQISRQNNQVARHIRFKEEVKPIYPREIFAVIFQNLNAQEIAVAAKVCKEWYVASKQNEIWLLYLKRDFAGNIQNSIIISCELEYKNQYLSQIFNRLICEYRYQSHQFYDDRSLLETKWQALLVFADRYPRFKEKLPEKIELPPEVDKTSLIYDVDRWVSSWFFKKTDYPSDSEW